MELTAPLNVHWELTNVCNLRCVHCYQQDDGPRKPLPATEVLDTIAHRIVEADVFEVTLTGGEPLLVPQLPRLVRFFNAEGIRPHITSNGMLVDEPSLQWLSEVNVTYQVSLDAADPATHNRIRRSQAAFRQAVEGAERAARRGVPVTLSFTAMPGNLTEVGRLLALAESIGATRLCVGEILPYFGSRERRDQLRLTGGQVTTLTRELHALRDAWSGRVELAVALQSGDRCDEPGEGSVCTALDRDMAILHDGWAYPCPFVRSATYRLGNVVDQPIRSIWAGRPAARFRSEKEGGSPKHCTLDGPPRAAPVTLSEPRLRPPSGQMT